MTEINDRMAVDVSEGSCEEGNSHNKQETHLRKRYINNNNISNYYVNSNDDSSIANHENYSEQSIWRQRTQNANHVESKGSVNSCSSRLSSEAKPRELHVKIVAPGEETSFMLDKSNSDNMHSREYDFADTLEDDITTWIKESNSNTKHINKLSAVSYNDCNCQENNKEVISSNTDMTNSNGVNMKMREVESKMCFPKDNNDAPYKEFKAKRSYESDLRRNAERWIQKLRQANKCDESNMIVLPHTCHTRYHQQKNSQNEHLPDHNSLKRESINKSCKYSSLLRKLENQEQEERTEDTNSREINNEGGMSRVNNIRWRNVQKEHNNNYSTKNTKDVSSMECEEEKRENWKSRRYNVKALNSMTGTCKFSRNTNKHDCKCDSINTIVCNKSKNTKTDEQKGQVESKTLSMHVPLQTFMQQTPKSASNQIAVSRLPRRATSITQNSKTKNNIYSNNTNFVPYQRYNVSRIADSNARYINDNVILSNSRTHAACSKADMEQIHCENKQTDTNSCSTEPKSKQSEQLSEMLQEEEKEQEEEEIESNEVLKCQNSNQREKEKREKRETVIASSSAVESPEKPSTYFTPDNSNTCDEHQEPHAPYSSFGFVSISPSLGWTRHRSSAPVLSQRYTSDKSAITTIHGFRQLCNDSNNNNNNTTFFANNDKSNDCLDASVIRNNGSNEPGEQSSLLESLEQEQHNNVVQKERINLPLETNGIMRCRIRHSVPVSRSIYAKSNKPFLQLETSSANSEVILPKQQER